MTGFSFHVKHCDAPALVQAAKPVSVSSLKKLNSV